MSYDFTVNLQKMCRCILAARLWSQTMSQDETKVGQSWWLWALMVRGTWISVNSFCKEQLPSLTQLQSTFGSGEHMECPLIHRQMNLQGWRWKCSSELFPSSSVRKTYAGSSRSLALSHPHLAPRGMSRGKEKELYNLLSPVSGPTLQHLPLWGHIPLASQQPFLHPISSSFSCLSAPHGVSLWPETCIPKGWSLQESRAKHHLSWSIKVVQLPSGKMTFKWNIYKPKFNLIPSLTGTMGLGPVCSSFLTVISYNC